MKSLPRFRRAHFLAAATLVAASFAHAADGTWNVNADGTWSTASNWAGSTVADLSGFTANFTNDITANRTVTLSAPQTIGNIVFDDAGATGDSAWTITGSTLTLAGGTPTITTNTNATISSAIGGTAGLTKEGAGTLVLFSATSNYSGGTILNAGILSIAADSNPTTANATVTAGPLGTGTLTLNGGTLNVFNTGIGNRFIANAIAVTGTTALTTAGFNLNLNGPISGSGTLNSSVASLWLQGDNSAFAGTFNLSGGANFSNANSGSALAAWNLTSGDLCNYQAATTTSRTIDLGALSGAAGTRLANRQSTGTGFTTTFSIGALGTDTTFAGTVVNAISGNGLVALTKVGSGTLTLSGANTYTGGTTISAGTLNAASNKALGNGAVSVAGGTLAINDTSVGQVTLGTGANLAMTSGKIAINITDAATFDKILGTGTGHFTLTGGTLELFGFSGFEGTGVTGNTYNLLSGFAGTGNSVGGTFSITGYDTTNWLASLNAATGQLSFSTVPEPSAYGLIGAGSLAAAAFVRRRRRVAGSIVA